MAVEVCGGSDLGGEGYAPRKILRQPEAYSKGQVWYKLRGPYVGHP